MALYYRNWQRYGHSSILPFYPLYRPCLPQYRYFHFTHSTGHVCPSTGTSILQAMFAPVQVHVVLPFYPLYRPCLPQYRYTWYFHFTHFTGHVCPSTGTRSTLSCGHMKTDSLKQNLTAVNDPEQFLVGIKAHDTDTDS